MQVMAGNLGHDYNNLLTAMLGNLELMRNRVNRGRLDNLEVYLDGIQSAAQRMAALTNRLLTFAGAQHLNPQPICLNSFIAALADELQTLTAGGVSLRVIEPAAELWVLADPAHLKDALFHLAQNGCQAMPQSGTLTIQLQSAGTDVDILVSDTGTGIAETIIDRVVEPFYSTHGTGFARGLGLSVTYGFARQSGGNLKIANTCSEGTCVVLSLPGSTAR